MIFINLMIFKFQAKCRENKTKEEKDLANQKKKEKQIENRANMSKEEKDAAKEKDRLRKKKKAQGKKILAKHHLIEWQKEMMM